MWLTDTDRPARPSGASAREWTRYGYYEVTGCDDWPHGCRIPPSRMRLLLKSGHLTRGMMLKDESGKRYRAVGKELSPQRLVKLRRLGEL